MQDRHIHPEKNPGEQAYTTARYVLPFIAAVMPITSTTSVLEIGCGEGGNLEPFLDLGCPCVGVDLAAEKLAIAARHFTAHRHRDRLTLLHADVHTLPPGAALFDLVIVRDAIEHIHDQARFLGRLQGFVAPAGRVFVGFPPWQHPFGGHQHHLASRVLSRAPYWHILPRWVCTALMRSFGESSATIDTQLAIKASGLSIERFERLVRANGFTIETSTHFLINPNFEIKFGLTPRRQAALVRRLPWVRNFLTTTAYYILTVAVDTGRIPR